MANRRQRLHERNIDRLANRSCKRTKLENGDSTFGSASNRQILLLQEHSKTQVSGFGRSLSVHSSQI